MVLRVLDGRIAEAFKILVEYGVIFSATSDGVFSFDDSINYHEADELFEENEIMFTVG